MVGVPVTALNISKIHNLSSICFSLHNRDLYQKCLKSWIHWCIFPVTYLYIWLCIMHTHIDMHIYTSIYMYVGIYVYDTHTHTHTQLCIYIVSIYMYNIPWFSPRSLVMRKETRTLVLLSKQIFDSVFFSYPRLNNDFIVFD